MVEDGSESMNTTKKYLSDSTTNVTCSEGKHAGMERSGLSAMQHGGPIVETKVWSYKIAKLSHR